MYMVVHYWEDGHRIFAPCVNADMALPLERVTFTMPFSTVGPPRIFRTAGCPLAGIPGKIRLPVVVVGQLPKMLTISIHHVKIGIPRIIYRHKQNLPAIG
jgi:hypothetical protein